MIFSSLEFSALSALEKPGPGNTGCGDVTGLTPWPYEYIISGVTGPVVYENYYFNSRLEFRESTDITFRNCLFSGTVPYACNCPPGVDCDCENPDCDCCVGAPNLLIQGYPSDNITSGLHITNCTFANSKSSHIDMWGQIDPPANHIIEYCDFSQTCKTGMHINRDATIRHNWFHDLGYDSVSHKSHGDPINCKQIKCGTGGRLEIHHNNIDQPYDRLWFIKGTPWGKVNNCYSRDDQSVDQGIVLGCQHHLDSDCSGTMFITDNWVNAGNVGITYGVLTGLKLFGDFTLTGNKIGRDFGTATAGTAKGGEWYNAASGTVTKTIHSNVFQDGEPIPDGSMYRPRHFNRWNCTQAADGDKYTNSDGESWFYKCPNVPWCCAPLDDCDDCGGDCKQDGDPPNPDCGPGLCPSFEFDPDCDCASDCYDCVEP